MKKYLGYLVFIMLFILGAYCFLWRMEYNQRDAFEAFKTRAFAGQVIDKSKDTLNHNYPYIKIHPDIGKLYFELDLGSFFDSVQVGDNILKYQYSDTIWIIRNGRRTPHIVNYGSQ